MRTRKFTLILLLFHSSCLMLAQSDVLPAAGARHGGAAREQPESIWYSPTRVSLSLQAEGGASTMAYDISGNQDLKIVANAQGKRGQQETFEIMLINGRCQWMLAKGAPIEKGYEIDALDGPVLILKLVTELLRTAVPGGPGQVTKSTTFNIQEKAIPIKVNTASANGGIEAPWTLQGKIEPTTVAAQWSFDLTVTGDDAMHVTGTWQKDAAAPVFSDDMSLAGWQILSLGPAKRVEQNATIYDYGAQISQKQPKTLGELRKLSAE